MAMLRLELVSKRPKEPPSTFTYDTQLDLGPDDLPGQDLNSTLGIRVNFQMATCHLPVHAIGHIWSHYRQLALCLHSLPLKLRTLSERDSLDFEIFLPLNKLSAFPSTL